MGPVIASFERPSRRHWHDTHPVLRTSRLRIHAETMRLRRCAPEVISQINCVLDADHFDDAAIRALATRQLYADSAWLLSRATQAESWRINDLVPAILGNSRIAPNRLAIVFVANTGCVPDTEDLKALGTPGAKCALAALGIIEWSTATREARAAFALRKLVLTFRDRQQ